MKEGEIISLKHPISHSSKRKTRQIQLVIYSSDTQFLREGNNLIYYVHFNNQYLGQTSLCQINYFGENLSFQFQLYQQEYCINGYGLYSEETQTVGNLLIRLTSI